MRPAVFATPEDRLEAMLAVKQVFHRLEFGEFGIVSEQEDHYNCIAYAANDDTTWWWPSDPKLTKKDHTWPEGLPREATIDNFIEAFRRQGYELCSDSTYEVGVEKVALYAKDCVK